MIEKGLKLDFKKPQKVKLGLLVFIVISSIVFGFLGGIVGVYSLVNKNGMNNTIQFGNKTYKVTEDSASIDAVEKASPSVVSISATSNIKDIFGRNVQEQISGSGFIVTSDGLIVTNKHVASDTNANYTVFTNDGKGYGAKVVATDPLNDIALLKIDASNLTPIDLGDSNELKIGQKVIAIGNALGFQNSVTQGIISAKERTIQATDTTGTTQETLEGLLQTDAAINSGNSGGPLINLDGQVIGINTAVADKNSAEGIGFAIPIDIATSALNSYKQFGRIVRPFIGVRYISLNKEIASQYDLLTENGAYIHSGDRSLAAVSSNGPAEKAGLKDGDIIIAVNGEKIDENHSLSRLIQKYQPGEKIELTYIRDKQEEKTKVTLIEYQQ